MKRYILPLFAALLSLVSCGSQEDCFVIEGTINNLGGYPLYAVYETADAIVVDTMRPQEGEIVMKGYAPERVPVQLYNVYWEPFMRLYLKNSERVELKGDAQAIADIKMKGNALNRRLWKLVSSHYSLFTEAVEYGKRLDNNRIPIDTYRTLMQPHDSLLIAYISKNKSDELSGFLLGDYLLRQDNFELCDSLWLTLQEKAQVPAVQLVLDQIRERRTFNEDNTRLPYLRQLNDCDTITYVNPRNSKAVLLGIWAAEAANARSHYYPMHEYARDYEKKDLQVVAFSFDRDTALWHRAIDGDTTHIVNLWGDGLYTSRLMKNYNINSFPVFMLGDKEGNILVRTSHLPDSDIDAQLDSLLNVENYKLETPIFKP